MFAVETTAGWALALRLLIPPATLALLAATPPALSTSETALELLHRRAGEDYRSMAVMAARLPSAEDMR